MTASAGPVLKRLHGEFGDKVSFLTLYVREAHPGEHYPQPEQFERKLEHARGYRERDELPWPVAVDEIDGALHRRLDPKPSSAYFIDANGRVVSRVLWSNYEPPLREALEALVAGESPARPEREPRMMPMLSGVGKMDEILSASGQVARRDVLREAPPIYGLARLAGLFRPLPPLARTAAAMAVITGAAVLAGAALRRGG